MLIGWFISLHFLLPGRIEEDGLLSTELPMDFPDFSGILCVTQLCVNAQATKARLGKGLRWFDYWSRLRKHRFSPCLAPASLSPPPAPAALEREGTTRSMGLGDCLISGGSSVRMVMRDSLCHHYQVSPLPPLLMTKAKAARSCSREAVLAHTWTWVVWLAQNYPCREACTSDSRLQLGVPIFCALWYMSVSPK